MKTNETNAKRGIPWATVAMAVIVVGGTAAGVVWREEIAEFLGLHAHETAGDGSVQLWTCGMHPQVIRNKPGDCPICHMKLTPLKKMDAPKAVGAAGPGMEVTIDPVQVQNMGVRTAAVTEGALRRGIRVVGYVEEAEPNVHEVNLRVSGWIEKLYANAVGMHIHKGEPLFELYSPEVQLAIEELIASRRAAATAAESKEAKGGDALGQGTAELLTQGVRQKLKLWGLDDAQINAFEKLDHAPRTVTFTSPVEAHLTEKMVAEGAAVTAGMRVLRLVDHSNLWLEVHVFEQDLPFVHVGQKVAATVESMPGRELGGEIFLIHPHIDMTTRTATVRIALPNPELTLRPGMSATARITAEISPHAILVPREAVIDSGEGQVVFVIKPEGHFEPRTVKMGAAGDGGVVQILDGLKAGEQVVTSGQFLLDSESRLREAIAKHMAEGLLKPGEKMK